jgi:hypothetical protein
MGYKALLVPYEHIAALPDTKRCYRLSDRTVALLLTQTEYLQWRTRWAHDAQPLSDDEWLLASELAAQVERELAKSDDGMQFRVQNCLLQYRCGESSPWETLVDLSACRPSVPVSVRPDGTIEIGETVIDTGAPLGEETVGTPERPTTIPIQPVVTVPGLTPCEAAVNLARALVELHTRMCDRLNNPNQFDLLTAVAVAGQLIMRFFKFKWLLDVLDALSDAFEMLDYCRRFDVQDEEQLACMILQVTTIVENSPVVNRGTLVQLLVADGREQFAAVAFLIGYLNDSALNYAAQPLGQMDCPCEVVRTCVYQQPNWQNHAQILFDYGTWVSDGLRGVRFSFNPTNYRAVTVRINHGSADARWKRVVIDTTMPPSTRGALRVSQSGVYTTWENLTEFVGPFGASFEFVYATSSPASPKTEILLETLTDDFVARRVTFYEAANMVNAECSVI